MWFQSSCVQNFKHAKIGVAFGIDQNRKKKKHYFVPPPPQFKAF
jgi:hypothetical protein